VLNKLLVVIVKKLFKSVHIYWSYRQNNPGGPFFWNTRYRSRNFSNRNPKSTSHHILNGVSSCVRRGVLVVRLEYG